MSNFLAIATATESLRRVLDTAVKADVTGATATTVQPRSNGGASGLPNVGVNVYLYQVSPNAHWRNADLPSRNANAQLIQRPQVALDLHYLLTFYGDDTQLEPQRLLGSVARTLHTQPLITRAAIEQIVKDASDPGNPNPPHPYLAGSDLAEQVDLIRFSPLSLNLDELSKLWSVFFQTPYALSVAYQGMVVLIESEVLPRKALPVRQRGVFAIPFQRPIIEQVSPQVVQAGDTLTLRGQNLTGAVTRVVFDRTIEATPVGGDTQEISILISPALRAGIHTVHVRHDLDLGTAVEPHHGFTSNVMAFALATRVTSTPPFTAARNTLLTLDLVPSVERTQEISLLVGDQAIPVQRDDTTPILSTSASFLIPGDFPVDIYLLRVQVDGAHSPLVVDEDETSPTFGQYIGPTVDIT